MPQTPPIVREIQARIGEHGDIDINSGQHARVTASGQWGSDNYYRGVGGNLGEPKADTDWPAPGSNEFCLLIFEHKPDGRILKWPFNSDGAVYEFDGPTLLRFRINDPDDGLADNAGLITVTAEITP